jgi:hypothetical protein
MDECVGRGYLLGFNVGIERQLDSFRAARREIEASVLPLATSVDGRRFTFQASLYGLLALRWTSNRARN